jgi:hypothetical protein
MTGRPGHVDSLGVATMTRGPAVFLAWKVVTDQKGADET